MEALSHSIIEREEKGVKKLQICYVDNENNLKICDFDGKNENLLDTSVTKVFAKNTPISCDDDFIVCYIKNGRAKYITFAENIVASPRELPLPLGEYIDVGIVNSDDDYIYCLVTNSSGANFILKSILEVSTGKFVESVKLDASMV